MKKEGYYSIGDLMKKAHVTKKTLRYYDEHNILKPSFVEKTGARFYTENDFAKLQQILFLKYLSFSLDEIRNMTVRNNDEAFWAESLQMQANLLEQRMNQLEMMRFAIQNAQNAVAGGGSVDWGEMMSLISTNEMDRRLKTQYMNTSNIEARIYLHNNYAMNKEGWFPWVYRQCKMREGMQVLELGCGDLSFWTESAAHLPRKMQVYATDISDGIIEAAKKKAEKIEEEDVGFRCVEMDAHDIPFPENSIDLVIANHMLFYCEDIPKVLQQVKRVLKPEGVFICSTYGRRHMAEISELVQGFDSRIVLSGEKLYEKFGKENGLGYLTEYFSHVQWKQYEDSLEVDEPGPVINYVLSCHGNQSRYIVDAYHDFYEYVKKRTDEKFVIHKDAGIFVCSNMEI